MAPRKPAKGTTNADSRSRPDAPLHGNTGQAPRSTLESSFPLGSQTRPATPQGIADLDAARPSTVVIAHSTSVETGTPGFQPLEHYWIAKPDHMPQANLEGLRMYKGREYVDVAYDGIVMVDVDPHTGLYRAQLAAERVASGPLLLRDADSGLWNSLNDGDAVTLFDTHLQTLRTNLDLTVVRADGNGIFRFDGRLYLILHNHVYQVMHDVGASTSTQKAWRIVNPKDPVAIDIANIYRASRSGETRTVRRAESNGWVYHLPILKGRIPEAEIAGLGPETLKLMSKPFQEAHTDLKNSSDQHNELWAEAKKLPEGSAERNAKLLNVEVNLLRHVHKQADFVESLLLNKDWLIRAKAKGLFKQELHTFRMERVEFLNRLMAAMDLRVKPTFSRVDADSCKKVIPHLNKKLRFIEEREVVMAEIKKSDPGAAPLLEEIRRQVPSAERINFNKLTLFVHLYAGTPEHAPNTTMPSLASIDLITGDLKNVPQRDHPMALLLTLDQIRTDKYRFEKRQADVDVTRAEYIREIVSLIGPFEKRIENRLSEILDSFDRNTALPSVNHDIDFDFLPPQPDPSENAHPVSRRKVFRVRQHGTYRVMVGDMETHHDGSVIVRVPDPLRPDYPSARYEKRQGEWLPVRSPITQTPRPQLIAKARQLLADVEQHAAKARADEAKKTNPSEILDDLDDATESLNEQARRLESLEDAIADSEVAELATHLRTAAGSLAAQGQKVLVRMYKNRNVLDIMRLNYLMDAHELNVSKTVDRKQLGKGESRSFLDVYSLRDCVDDSPLWEAHFHYDQHDTLPLNFKKRGGHLKTLAQSRRGLESQRRDEQAGLPHVAIWRQTFDGKTATKIFALASPAAVLPRPE
ncbi:hypothetical protein [Pseudomonas sp. TNT2022 ID642]|uniref:hypothetical protein n=1 Tax=Pseudomonas sp. TNT2022 ID642 TaxID=2942632 RepID=UPI00235F27CC|nr:hypothetical protein [Pseudomonas sp. TNT2022 ID642]MDD1003369.1 hypothetical protein [Pseudomonas sp. TNT2022 ID642]